MDLHAAYPALSDLRARAKRRIPPFVWEYLDSGTGTEATKARNRSGLDRIGLMPSVLHGEVTPDLTTAFLGETLPLPFGISPIGMSGLIWPDAEGHLARAGRAHNIPYCLSTVATHSPADIAPHLGPQAWFQMYPPRVPEIRRDIGDHPTYLTYDIDSLDPAFAPGTGTPEIGGLTSMQALQLIRSLRGVNLVGGDLVEVSPPYDPSGNTALTGANILYEMMCVLPGVAYR